MPRRVTSGSTRSRFAAESMTASCVRTGRDFDLGDGCGVRCGVGCGDGCGVGCGVCCGVGWVGVLAGGLAAREPGSAALRARASGSAARRVRGVKESSVRSGCGVAVLRSPGPVPGYASRGSRMPISPQTEQLSRWCCFPRTSSLVWPHRQTCRIGSWATRTLVSRPHLNQLAIRTSRDRPAPTRAARRAA